MANSGSVRIIAPAGLSIFVGINSPTADVNKPVIGTPVPLGSGGGNNLFSPWIKGGGFDTLIYAVNHNADDATYQVRTTWRDSNGTKLADTYIDVPYGGMRQIPASANVPV